MWTYWFTPDDPQDSSPTSTGTFNNGEGEEYRCVRIRRAHPNEDGQVDFMAAHMAFAPFIEKHGPKFYGLSRTDRCVYLEYIGGVSLEKYLTRDINPWTAEGASQLQQVVDNTLHIIFSLAQDKFTAEPRSLDGYKVQPDMSVRQVDFNSIHYFGRRSYFYGWALEEFKGILAIALEANVRNREGTLSNADFQAQLASVPGMTDDLM